MCTTLDFPDEEIFQIGQMRRRLPIIPDGAIPAWLTAALPDDYDADNLCLCNVDIPAVLEANGYVGVDNDYGGTDVIEAPR